MDEIGLLNMQLYTVRPNDKSLLNKMSWVNLKGQVTSTSN